MRADTKSAIALAENPMHHGRTKNIEIRYHFMMELMEARRIILTQGESLGYVYSSVCAYISETGVAGMSVPLSAALFQHTPMMQHHHGHHHPHVVEYLRRDMCPPICKVVTPLGHFGLEFASDSACLSLLFCRLFHLFFEPVRCILRVFRPTVFAGMLPLTVFAPRYLGSYCVMSDFESGFSGLCLGMLSACFEDHLTCFDCCEC